MSISRSFGNKMNFFLFGAFFFSSSFNHDTMSHAFHINVFIHFIKLSDSQLHTTCTYTNQFKEIM